jgi:AraC-like DNA-binding protein
VSYGDRVAYEERPSSIEGAVVWTRVADGSDSWILPDGCMDLIWDGGSLFVAGPDTGPFLSRAAAGTPYTAIRFSPGMGPSVFGLPADQVRNQRIALAELWAPGDVARVVEQLQGADDVALVLEAVSAARLSEAPADPLLAEVVRLVDAGRPIAEVADTVGLSDRQLHRRSLVAFGYGPKVLARILRLRRALALARNGSSFARASVEAGYADQAHLAREVRALAGAPLTQLT